MRNSDPSAALLRAASAVSLNQEFDDWPLPRRHVALLEMRCVTFGPIMRAVMDCPDCTEPVEFELDGRALLNLQNHANTQPLQVRGLSFRLPTTVDLATLDPIEDERSAIVQLVRRCCLEAAAPESWPDDLIAALDEQFEAADPLGNMQLVLECPGCRCSWNQSFDIARYFWEEIDVRARTILVQVHRLARAYGWSETDVLALSAVRRQAYLELLDA